MTILAQVILLFFSVTKIEGPIFENQKFQEKNSEATVGPYLKKWVRGE